QPGWPRGSPGPFTSPAFCSQYEPWWPGLLRGRPGVRHPGVGAMSPPPPLGPPPARGLRPAAAAGGGDGRAWVRLAGGAGRARPAVCGPHCVSARCEPDLTGRVFGGICLQRPAVLAALVADLEHALAGNIADVARAIRGDPGRGPPRL